MLEDYPVWGSGHCFGVRRTTHVFLEDSPVSNWALSPPEVDLHAADASDVHRSVDECLGLFIGEDQSRTSRQVGSGKQQVSVTR